MNRLPLFVVPFRPTLIQVLTAAALVATVACSKKPSTDQTPATPASGERIAVPGSTGGGTATGAKPVAPTGPDTSFNVAVTSPTAGKAGTEVIGAIDATPGKGFHVNHDYPTKLVMQPTAGVTVTKAKMDATDATKFDDNLLRFEVKLKADHPGKFTVLGTLDFAVCEATSCDPKTKNIAIDIEAT